jgi:hypothetical protein
MAISLAASALFGLFLWLFYAGLFDPGHFTTGCPLSRYPSTTSRKMARARSVISVMGGVGMHLI